VLGLPVRLCAIFSIFSKSMTDITSATVGAAGIDHLVNLSRFACIKCSISEENSLEKALG
jgi:hypothetical protein